MCKARPRIDEHVFKRFHAEILRRADQPGPLWLGHRVFAVDGSKLTLPRALLEAGYRTPGEHAHYPQGLLSCLLRLQSRLPVDFDLCAHTNERTAALAHLKALAAPDLVVYDRGYYCFELLCAHLRRGLHAVFRLSRNICPAIDGFIDGDRTDTLVRILPGPDTLRDLSRKYPGSVWRPVPLRLVKYTHATTTYVLGTTVLDPCCISLCFDKTLQIIPMEGRGIFWINSLLQERVTVASLTETYGSTGPLPGLNSLLQ